VRVENNSTVSEKEELVETEADDSEVVDKIPLATSAEEVLALLIVAPGLVEKALEEERGVLVRAS